MLDCEQTFSKLSPKSKPLRAIQQYMVASQEGISLNKGKTQNVYP